MKDSLTLGERMKIICPYCKCEEGIKKYAYIKVFHCTLCGKKDIDPYNQYKLYYINIKRS